MDAKRIKVPLVQTFAMERDWPRQNSYGHCQAAVPVNIVEKRTYTRTKLQCSRRTSSVMLSWTIEPKVKNTLFREQKQIHKARRTFACTLCLSACHLLAFSPFLTLSTDHLHTCIQKARHSTIATPVAILKCVVPPLGLLTQDGWDSIDGSRFSFELAPSTPKIYAYQRWKRRVQ